MNMLLAIIVTITAFLVAYPSHAQGAPEQAAEERENPKVDEALEKANKLFQEDKLQEAETAYRALREQKTKLSTWGVASFNLGINLRAQKKYDEAIQVFTEILDSKLNDKDPGSNIMENFQNYHYKACLQIAFTYKAQKKYPKSLEYMELAHSKHKFVSHCATCDENAQKDWDEVVNAIKAAMKK